MTDDKPRDVERDALPSGQAGRSAHAVVGKVVLVRSRTWPEEPGVCCWRSSVHVAFAELGLDVTEVDGVEPPAEEVRATVPEPSGPVEPAPVRREAPTAVRALRRVGRVGGRRAKQLVGGGLRAADRRWNLRHRLGPAGRRLPGGRGPASGGQPGQPRTEPDPRLARLAGARLVIVESERDAIAVVRAGVPRPRVWLLAIPPERVGPGEPVSWAGPLRDAAPRVGGLLTDSLDAVGTLERVVGSIRTAVFPPLVVDRPCPSCGSAPPGDSTAANSAAESTAAESDRDPTPYPTDVLGHLRLWRWLLSDVDGAERWPYTYAIARVRAVGVDAPSALDDGWDGTAGVRRVRLGAVQPGWDLATQRNGARRVLAALPSEVAPGSAGRRRVRVFGTDLRFMRDLSARLAERDDLDVGIDEWPSAGTKNDGISEQLARGGQTLVAEWCRPNAVWLSRVKRDDQYLVVRLHRYEIDMAYPRQLDIDKVDAVVHVGPHMGARLRDELGWPAEKLVHVPLFLDLPKFNRPKHPDARFTLGMVGIVPALKRFDLALDLLAALRREEPRFSLHVRSQFGWTHQPTWQLPEQRQYIQRCMERIEKDPLLRGAVVFDAYGSDMAAWFRKIGHVLSLSDVESFHAGLAEGMGSGAVPVLRGWSGAAELYGTHWIAGSARDAVSSTLAATDPDRWAALSARAKHEAGTRFDPAEVLAAWVDLAHGRLADARVRFPSGVEPTTVDAGWRDRPGRTPRGEV